MKLRSLGLGLLSLGLLASIAGASTQGDLDAAARQGKVAFILVTDQGAAGPLQARETIQQAMMKVKNSTLVELNRADAANAGLVSKFRLAGAPVPLILVAARNGVLAGGLAAAQATPDQLVALVPSPKKAETLQALQTGKAVFLCMARKSMSSRSSVSSTCALACGQMNDKGVTITIDMDDPEEAEFLTQLKVDRTSAEPVTLVANPQGQITGTFAGAVDVASLVQAASKRATGCCPSTAQGGAKTCAPTPKK